MNINIWILVELWL